MNFIVMGSRILFNFTGSSYIEFGHRGHFMHGKFQPRLTVKAQYYFCKVNCKLGGKVQAMSMPKFTSLQAKNLNVIL